MKKYKYLFLDIDGVLLNKETDTSEDCWFLLNKLKEIGVSVSFVTSRPYGLSRHLSEKIKGYQMGVYDNGGYVVDHEEIELISENLVNISPSLLQLISQELSMGQSFMIGISCGNIFHCNGRYYDYLSTYMANYGYRKNTAEEILSKMETEKVNSIWIKNSSKGFVDKLTKISLANTKISSNKDAVTGLYSVYIHPLMSVKENGLLSLALNKKFDLNKAVFVGDTDSDIGVAKMIGLSACPLNATENMKKTVNYVAVEKYSQGVVEILDGVFKPNI